MKKKILIIGGTGFLGSSLCKYTKKKKFNTISVSSHKTKFKKIDKVKYIFCDITKTNEIEKKLNFNVDYVVNFSGYVDHSNKKKTYQSHYIGCKNLVNFFQKKKIKKFIQVGSSLEYGKTISPHYEKFKKKDLNSLKSVYAKSKFLATKYCLEAFKKNFFPVTIVRPYLVYGPGQKSNRLIPFIISESLKNKNFPCSNGNQVRNFLFIDDFIKGIFKILSCKNVNGEIINIGSNENLRIKKVILMITNYIKLGKPLFGKIKLRKDESLRYYPNIKKAKKLINWKPLIRFENGMTKTIKYFLKNYDKKIFE